MTTDHDLVHLGHRPDLPLPVGRWRVDPVRSSATFEAGLAGRRFEGRLPLSGGAIVTPTVEDSTAELVAMTDAVMTGHGLVKGR